MNWQLFAQWRGAARGSVRRRVPFRRTGQQAREVRDVADPIGIDGDDDQVGSGDLEGHLEAGTAGKRELVTGSARAQREHRRPGTARDGAEQGDSFIA